ncbi:MAG: metal ABC transporter ATP-binding protein [Treponema sp.]
MLTMKNLSFRYDAYSKYILEDISFEVKKGEYVSIVGENGCGKSTLVRLLLGLLKPTSGEVQRKANSIGYVPQKKINLTHFPLTVFELLDSYRKVLKVKEKDTVYTRLKEVGLLGFERKLAGELSGGQLQKLYIARSLINEPELLILDEPSTGIDIRGQKEIYTILKRLNQDLGITIISVDHNLNAAIANSTVIFHITNGKGHFCNPKKYAVEAVPSNF